MATLNQLTQFDNILKTWRDFDFSKVYREDLGSESFKELSPLIIDLNDKIERANEIKKVLSDLLLSQFCKNYQNIIKVLIQIRGLDNGNFIAQKANLQSQLIAHKEELLNIWPQIVALLNDTKEQTDVQSLLKEIKNLTNKTSSDAKEIEELKLKLTTELEDFETKYKHQFQRVELVNQREVFEIQANDYKKLAFKWFVGIIISSVVLIIIMSLIFKSFCFDLSCFVKIDDLNYNSIYKGANELILSYEIFKSFTYRLLIISLGLYMISFCVRNYNANRHNYTVNMQKANSLNAALILLERAKTPEGNDSLMTQAASSIFSHQPTGYNKKDPENIQNSITEKLFDKINK